MRLSTKGRQAVTAMIDVALFQKTGPVTLASIAGRRQISISYLEQMFSDLRRHALVESTRGPGGGYKIARDLESISVADIIAAVDRVNTEPSFGQAPETRQGGQLCLTPELWTSLSQHVVEFLDSVSLKKLVDEQPAECVPVEGARVRPPEPRRARVGFSPPKAPNSVFQLAMLTR